MRFICIPPKVKSLYLYAELHAKLHEKDIHTLLKIFLTNAMAVVKYMDKIASIVFINPIFVTMSLSNF